MNKIIPAAAALIVALSAPQIALAQDHGRGHGGDHAKDDHGGGRQAARNEDRGPDRSGGGGNGRGRGHDDNGARGRGGEARAVIAPVARVEARVAERRNDDRRRDDHRREDRGPVRIEREVVRTVDRRDDRSPITVFRIEPDRGLVTGCPPGLAKKGNGCLPPGQARQIARARYDYLWARRNTDEQYRYDDGYLYRVDRGGSVMGWLPVLGGALAPGAVWPTQYSYQPVPQYYTSYYGLNDPYDYRYANGALYGVDPRTQAITQVVALLTGQPINVGQQMPAGYDVYNVPYAYRDQYVDTADSWYRYNDGYVYQVDPTTQLVQAAIQLLT
ncbi:hypothetical protein GGQ87_002573 [Brevundimonas alba]|uniref:RcnB family protein n=1 Tax=Brevundimonas alba TaxID=74314 RepID=A0A7X6BNK9_9CAUL|nr:hypothetical protein [Brevundimonas alba]NJC42278.1 hypothetical protein [Brevundimonas alba]